MINDDLVEKINKKVKENRRFAITELSECFPQISPTVLYEIVGQKLGYHKFCARWVSKSLTDALKMNRQGAALKFLTRYDEEGDEMFDHIVIGDETWVSYISMEQKNQSRVLISRDKLKHRVNQWLNEQATEFFSVEIENFL